MNGKCIVSIDRKVLKHTEIERKVERWVHDPIRLETGSASENLSNFNIKAVRLG